ncbi:MXAN_6230/SCO0854 family RING domain-containing protein [Nonomuraea sp. NPDC049750]|uniref:MXAN_6230/SCO0854 family RING domain-containing protein n=1 Tax=Nonomuraea sp. NPDC049750 TaxID=3154738 RepID=UPI0034061783
MNGPAEILLRRTRVVAPALLAADPRMPEAVGKLPKSLNMTRAEVRSGVAALEFELLQLGFLVSAELYRALVALSSKELTRVGRRLLHGLRGELGAAVSHVPLFRKFPDSVPRDTGDFYVRRVFSLLLQQPERPCVLCGNVGTVHAVSPCAHLVCRTCWDGADFSACPICHRRVDPDDPFLLPSEERTSVDRAAVTATGLLRLAGDPTAACREVAVDLMTRRTPMPPHDRADLEALLEAFWPESGDWLPESVPVKETRAVVLAVALRRGAPELLRNHLETATDVLRLLYVLMDADPGLRIRPGRRVSLPRAVRRTLLSCLDAMPYAIEDLFRYGGQWKRMAEVLHPHEHHARYPNAALAFAAVRGTRLDPETAFGRTLLELAARRPEVLRVRDGRLVATSFASRVETALADGRHSDAADLLVHRPGELMRRLSQLLRLSPGLLETIGRAEADTPASGPASAGLAGVATSTGLSRVATSAGLAGVAARVAPGVLLAALGQLRTPPGGLRLFLPRGGTARFHTRRDDRPPLPDEVVLEAERTLAAELLRRAAALPPLRRVLLDEGLADLIAPTSERTAVKTLVQLPRGSVQPIPGGERLRFFLHWAEPKDTRVDLDLSVAVFDERWAFVGLCDYTNLRLGKAVTHSGDLTSAPEPLGASEFIDVNVRALRGRYLVPVVFSYNDVPFEELVRGFAGFMEQPEGLFDPLAVRQRFDLTGQAKILVPLVADLWTRTMRWADFNLGAAGYGHSVDGSADELSLLGAALEQAFTHRVTLWEVGCWHAAARAAEVLVRKRQGEVVRYERRPGEDVAAFADRLMARADAPAVGQPVSFDGVELAVLVQGDLPLPSGCAAYALHPDGLGEVHQLGAADMLSGLSPDPVKVAT